MKTDMTENEARNLMVEVGQRLYGRNLLAAADGNISVKLAADRILMTPSGQQKGFLKADQMTVISGEGEVHSGQPSVERAMHLQIYRTCPQARAVVHAHPPYAVAWSLARPELSELPSEHLSEVILGAGRIPFVPYARPTTQDMGTLLSPFLPDCRALILSRHGAVCWGETLQEALNGMERLEHSAQTLWLAEQLGGSHPLPAEEVRQLRAMRAEFGNRLL